MRRGDIGTPAQLLGLTIAHAYEEYPREACGIWAGGGNFATSDHIFYMDNISVVPTRHFLVDRKSQLSVWGLLDARRLNPTVAYHSHCAGEAISDAIAAARVAVPSQDDIDNHDPSMAMLIIGLADLCRPVVAMYMINDGRPVSIDIPHSWGVA